MKLVLRSLVVFTCLVLVGCGYGKVSPTAYELAKSLYNISNRKLTDRIDEAKKQIDLAAEQKDISEKEEKWLRAIVAQAEAKNWQQAMTSARRIMEDQVGH